VILLRQRGQVVSKRERNSIGLVSGAPEPPPAPVVSDLTFTSGFESGSFSGWSSSYTDGGDLSVTTQAALTGACGLQAVLDDNNYLFLYDDSPENESRYRTRFYFDPNSITMSSGEGHSIFYARDGQSTVVGRIEFGCSAGACRVRAEILNDSSCWSSMSRCVPIKRVSIRFDKLF
jgi:hypothetical protein